MSIALDGHSNGKWSTGTTFTTTLSTTKASDFIMLHISANQSGKAVTVSGITDSQSAVTWQSSARKTSTHNSGVSNETTGIEWFGVSTAALTSDVITITIDQSNVAWAAVVAFGVSNVSGFDSHAGIVYSNDGASTEADISGISTTSTADFVAMSSHNAGSHFLSGAIGGAAATLIDQVSGFAMSQYVIATTALTSSSGVIYWDGGISSFVALCDALISGAPLVTAAFFESGPKRQYRREGVRAR